MTRLFGFLLFVVGLALLFQVSHGRDDDGSIVLLETPTRLNNGRFTYKTDSTEQLSDDRKDEKRRVDISDNNEIWYIWDGASNIEADGSMTSGGVTKAQKIEAFAATVVAVATAIFCNYVTKLFILHQSHH